MTTEEDLLVRIVVNAKAMVGKPTIKGTRITVEQVLRLLSQGWTFERIQQDYPQLKSDDIAAALLYAAKITGEKETRVCPHLKIVRIKKRQFCVSIIPQQSGKFVARAETSNFNATGQGETEAEAIQDITRAIKLLIDEEQHPSGEQEWPENYR